MLSKGASSQRGKLERELHALKDEYRELRLQGGDSAKLRAMEREIKELEDVIMDLDDEEGYGK